MRDDQKIAAAAREARDPDALDGIVKIRRAAAVSGATVHDSGAGDRKIHAAAIASGIRPYDNGAAGDRKIKVAAGQVGDGDDYDHKVMAKAMADLTTLAAALRRPRPSPPTRRIPARQPPPPPARQQPVSRAAPLRQAPAAAAPIYHNEHERLVFNRGLAIDSQHSYWDFRDRLAKDLRQKRIVHPTVGSIIQYTATNYGIGLADAAEWTERFLGYILRDRKYRAA